MIVDDGKIKTDDETMQEYNESSCVQKDRTPEINKDKWNENIKWRIK